jgi:hypothetical protein
VIGSDLTSLFAPPAAGEPYRQGEIVTFNPATGANSVRVGGAVFANLPVLVGGDTVNFEPGDAVVLLRFRGSWAILGRIVVPGGSLLTSAVDFFATGDFEASFDMTPVDTTRGSVTIPTPSWANSAVVFAVARLITANGSGSSDTAFYHVDIDGLTGPTSAHQVPDGNFQTICAPIARKLGAGGGVTPLGATTLVEAKARTNGGTWVGGGINSWVDVIAVFRHV